MDTKKVALVTGGSRGIGRGICIALGELGWNIIVNFRGNEEAANETVLAIEKSGGKGFAVQADIGQSGERLRLLEVTKEHWGRLDLLINNAGMAPRQRADLLEMSETSYDEVLTTNLKGPFFLTQSAAKWMIELTQAGIIENPAIVNIGSISAYTASINRGEYCISKAGMAMMTSLFADRLAEYGISVYEIRPGIISTDMTSGVQTKYDHLIADGLLPIHRWGTPEDVGKVIAGIAKGWLPYSTGEIINVDGGFHLKRL